MSKSEIKLGQLVSSQAGRDRENFFLVVAVGQAPFIYVADGERRKIENPKKKNIRHVKLYPQIATSIALKLLKGEKVTNSELKNALQEWHATGEIMV